MPKQYLDLNRIRKTYPLVRVKPRFVTMKENTESLEIARIQFSSTNTKDYYYENNYTEVPIIVVTPENENVIAFIQEVPTKKVTIEISDIPDENLNCDVYVHLQISGK